MRDRTTRPRGAAPASAARLALAAILALSAAGDAPARQNPDLTPPPPPPENFTPVTEAEVLAKLPERERQLVLKESDPKERFDRLLDVSDLRLAEVGARVDSRSGGVAPSLLLYEAVLRVADQVIRDPKTKAEPRDKRFKRFERRLSKQLPILQAVATELSYQDSSTGAAVVETVKRLRAAALNSALDVDILAPPEQE
jgi:hypothetical protein